MEGRLLLKKIDQYELIVSIILSGMADVGAITLLFSNEDSIAGFIYKNLPMVILIFFLLVIAIYAAVHFLFKLIDKSSDGERKDSQDIILSCSPKTWLKYAGVIFVCWLPYLIVCYPTITRGYDYFWQLLQGMGVFPLSNHHPVLGSLIYGVLFKVGYSIGGATFGLFFSTLVQMLLLSVASGFSYSCLCINQRVPKAIRYFILVYICLCPVFPGHATWLIKDSLFAAFGLLFFTQVYVRIKLIVADSRIPVVVSFPALVASGLVFSLIRNGTAPMVLVTLVVMLYAIIRKQRLNCSVGKKCIAAIAAFLVLTFIWNGIMSVLDVFPTDKRETLALPTRQIVRTVQLHSESITEADRAVIEEAYNEQLFQGLSIDEIVDRYDPMNADYIKIDFVNDDGFIYDYIRLWVRLGLKHPGSYIDAFIRGTDGYWNPMKNPHTEARGNISHTVCTTGPEDDFANETMREWRLQYLFTPTVKSLDYNGIDTHRNIEDLFGEYPWLDELTSVESAFPEARVVFGEWLARIENVPILSMILAPGTYLWVMLICFAYLFSRKKDGLYLWPIMWIDMIAWLSPINGYTRYVLLIEFFSIIMIALCFDARPEVRKHGTSEQAS